MLLVLHGSDSDAARFRELSGHTFDRLVTDGVVVAYAEAYGGIWNDARLGTRSPLASGLDDVEFLSCWCPPREEYAVPADVSRVLQRRPDGDPPGGTGARPVRRCRGDQQQPPRPGERPPGDGRAGPAPADADDHDQRDRGPDRPVRRRCRQPLGLRAARTGAVVRGFGRPVRRTQRDHRTPGLRAGHSGRWRPPSPAGAAGSGAGRLLRDRGRRPHGPEPRAGRATDPRRTQRDLDAGELVAEFFGLRPRAQP